MTSAVRVAATIAGCLSLAACLPSFGCEAESPNPNTAPDSFVVAFETSRGRFDVLARKDWAPIGVYRFHELVRAEFFDDARFFRVIEGFMAQFGLSGDPDANKRWKSRCIADEPVKHQNARGTMSFARAGEHSRSTQLFINYKNNAILDTLDGGFPAIGEVIAGMDVVDSLYSGYGDAAPKSGTQYGREGPRQDSIAKFGTVYLTSGWPKMDYIKTARIVQAWPAQ